MSRVVSGQVVRNVTKHRFADRASGLSLAPGEAAVIDPAVFDDDFACSGDALEGLSAAVNCNILKIES